MLEEKSWYCTRTVMSVFLGRDERVAIGIRVFGRGIEKMVLGRC